MASAAPPNGEAAAAPQWVPRFLHLRSKNALYRVLNELIPSECYAGFKIDRLMKSNDDWLRNGSTRDAVVRLFRAGRDFAEVQRFLVNDDAAAIARLRLRITNLQEVIDELDSAGITGRAVEPYPEPFAHLTDEQLHRLFELAINSELFFRPEILTVLRSRALGERLLSLHVFPPGYPEEMRVPLDSALSRLASALSRLGCGVHYRVVAARLLWDMVAFIEAQPPRCAEGMRDRVRHIYRLLAELDPLSAYS
jgi:hypothetical protein